MYTPDEWILVKVNGTDPYYRVFGSWRGGYLDGDSWRLNSGVESVSKEGDFFLFYGSSGSIYKCHKDTYGVRSPYNNGVVDSLCDYNMDVLTECPDVLNLNWIIGEK